MSNSISLISKPSLEGEAIHNLVSNEISGVKHNALRKKYRSVVAELPDEIEPLLEDFIDVWIRKAKIDKKFWQRKDSQIFDQISKNAQEILSKNDIEYDDEIITQMFSVIILSYALSAHQQPMNWHFQTDLRHLLPRMSTVGLLYPIFAILYLTFFTSSNWVSIIGYGIANLGYLLLVAGIIRGSFQVFHLTKRWQVIAASILSIVIGNLTLNL